MLAFERGEYPQGAVVFTRLEDAPCIVGRARRQLVPRLFARSLELQQRLLVDAARTVMGGGVLQGFFRGRDRVFVVAAGEGVFRPGGRRPRIFEPLPLPLPFQAKPIECFPKLYRGRRPW